MLASVDVIITAARTMKGGEDMRYNLYMLRCGQRLTKSDMAKRTGVSRTTYTYIEAGTRDGSQDFWGTLQREFTIPDEKMFPLMRKEEKQ